MGCVLLFLKKIHPHRDKQREVFKSIRDVPSAFNNVSTVTDYNFKATELKVIPQYCIADPYRSRFLRHWRPQMSVCTYTTKEISLKLSSITK